MYYNINESRMLLPESEKENILEFRYILRCTWIEFIFTFACYCVQRKKKKKKKKEKKRKEMKNKFRFSTEKQTPSLP